MSTKKSILCGSLIDCTGAAPRKNCTINIEDNKIVSVTDGFADLSEDSIDLRNCTVLPGFVDCHDHLGIDMGDDSAQAKEPLAYTVVKGVNNAKQILHKGITTLRDAAERDHIDVVWRQAINEGLMEGPNLLICGKFITRTGGHAWVFGNEADGVEGIRRSVREQIKVQVDWIKLMVSGGASTPGSVVTMAEYTEAEIAACIDEAHRGNKKVAAHIHGGPGVGWAIKHGVDTIEHGAFLTEEDLALMAEKGIWLVSTTALIWSIVNTPGMPEDYLAKAKNSFARVKNMLKHARRLGVKMAFGADTYHGHPAKELMILKEAGYSTIEALQILTINGAKLCGLQDSIGTIEAGKRADIIAIEGDPEVDSDSLENVRFVMKGGKVYKSH